MLFHKTSVLIGLINQHESSDIHLLIVHATYFGLYLHCNIALISPDDDRNCLRFDGTASGFINAANNPH